MNKFLILGDIHGRTIWKDIIKKENPDITIFLGDYCTTHYDISSEDQISNLKEILQYKKDNLDRVILLRGNHDDQMLGYHWAKCSGYDPVVAKYMSSIKDEFLDLTQWLYIIKQLDKPVVCSHAGLSTYFIDNCKVENLEDINKLPPSELFGFTPDSCYDIYGISKTQPCTWIRPGALLMYSSSDYHQIVGHTPVRNILVKTLIGGAKLYFCDTLENKQYLTITNSKININTYES